MLDIRYCHIGCPPAGSGLLLLVLGSSVVDRCACGGVRRAVRYDVRSPCAVDRMKSFSDIGSSM